MNIVEANFCCDISDHVSGVLRELLKSGYKKQLVETEHVVITAYFMGSNQIRVDVKSK